jgi:PAB-dependent poly(A)-specific ribonuclease subunit 2
MAFTSGNATKMLVAGWQDTVFVVDVVKGEIVKALETAHQYSHMKRSRYICAATTTGAVHLLDPTTFEVVKTWNAHSAMISNMDAQNDYIVTCGYSLRYGQGYALDSFLNVFDMRKMKSIKPIAFPAKAAFVRLHPRLRTTAFVVSQQGQMHIVDLDNDTSSSANMRQANVVSYLCMFDIAPSGEAIALADADSIIHLWGSPQRIRFLDYPIPTEFANPPDAPQADWGSNTPFNTVGMPYYRDELLSSWPHNLVSEVGAPPARMDARLLSTLAQADFGYYGRNPRQSLYRNQVESTRRTETASTSGIQAPKFLSEKARDSAKSKTPLEAEAEASEITALEHPGDGSASLVPTVYRSVEIRYSKFGVEDFDFRYYNKTRHSGLETHIANSYANSLLQLLHFTPLVRNLALRHVATDCVDENCMLCEMGFLSDMLQKAEGGACQATNMLKTLSRQPNGGWPPRFPRGSTQSDAVGCSKCAGAVGRKP